MMLSRAKPVNTVANKELAKEKKKAKSELEDFIKDRDYTGAITLLEVQFRSFELITQYSSTVQMGKTTRTLYFG